MSAIEVRVVKYGRKNLMLEWTDRFTGRLRHKSARTADPILAQRRAFDLEKELARSTQTATADPSWSDFKVRYLKAKKDEGLAPASLTHMETMFNFIDQHIRPERLSLITDEWLDRWVELLETTKGQNKKFRSRATVLRHIRTLKAALNFAVHRRMIPELPKFPQRKDLKRAKGRAVTGEEFERMLDALPQTVGKDKVAGWEFFLRGLYLTGMRLGESIKLHWDRWAATGVFLIEPEPGLFRIVYEGDGQKNRKTQTLELLPEFCEMLAAVPVEERIGYVFNPAPSRLGKSERCGQQTASNTISRLGKRAGIVTKRIDGEPVYAKAHDLRRAFLTRLAECEVGPAMLGRLARHQSAETTKQFYIDFESAAVERRLKTIPRLLDSSPVSTVVSTLGDQSGSSADVDDEAGKQKAP